MKFESFKWLEYAPGGYSERNKVISVSELWNRLEANDWGTNPAITDWYVSVCRFDENFRHYRDTHVNQWGFPTVERYEGMHIIDRAILEIDHPEGINGSIKFAGDVLKHLQDEHGIDQEKDLVKDGSGNKGFHIEIPAGLFSPEPHLKLFKIHKFFVESLLPAGWIKFGNLVDANSYQINRILRLRGTRNKEYGYKVSLNGEFALLGANPELIQALWAKPTKESIGKEFIDGSWYWQFEPRKNLVDLWHKSQDRAENDGKTKVFIPPSQRGKFSKAKIDKMPACIKAVHERMAENTRGDGLFNTSICGLTLYYLHAGYNAEATKRIVRGLTQPTAKTQDELDEIEKSMSSMIDEDGQPRYPWTCGKDSFPHLANFCANGDAKACPEACNAVEKTHARLTGIGDALNIKVNHLKEGADPYNFGIEPLDRFIGFIRAGSGVVLQAAPSVGKTAFMERILKHHASIARPRNELILWIPPEDDAEDTAEHIMMQRGRMTIRQLGDKAKNGGFAPVFTKWFEEYNDTIKIWNVQEFNVKEIETALEAAEATYKKKVAVVFYDGVAFLASDGTNKIAEAGVAQSIARLIKRKKTRGVFSVHPKKIEDDEKKGIKATNKRLGLFGAYGSMMFAALGRTVISLWKEDDFTLMIGAEKAKDRIDGEVEMLKPFGMVFDKYFNVWQEDEARTMSVSDFGRDPMKSFVKRPAEFSGL